MDFLKEVAILATVPVDSHTAAESAKTSSHADTIQCSHKVSPSPSVPSDVTVVTDEAARLQLEEMEVMSSIYSSSELLVLRPPCVGSGPSALYRVLLSAGYGATEVPAAWVGNIGLEFTLHHSYPIVSDCPPTIEVFTGALSLSDFPLAYRRDLLHVVNTVAREVCHDEGETCLLQCVQAASEWLADGRWTEISSSSSGRRESGVTVNGEGASDLRSNTTPNLTPLIIAESEEMFQRQEEEWVKIATLEASQAAARAKHGTADAQAGTSSVLVQGIQDAAVEVDTSSVHVAASARGVWEYTVGLVGKPSAGKVRQHIKYACSNGGSVSLIFSSHVYPPQLTLQSTFYNAVTRAALNARGSRLMAKVAPHPFTTIEPNIAPGWYASFQDESGEDGVGEYVRSSLHGRWEVCRAEDSLVAAASSEVNGAVTTDPSKLLCYANASYQDRRVLPLIIKDVAGLVPGAYKGRGKGNRFLSDLCDADVLVHVVDVTGKADRDGNIVVSTDEDFSCDANLDSLESRDGAISPKKRPNASTPSEDAEWIRHELHRWIFNNIKAKWHSVSRKGDNKCMPRVVALFSGYKGPSWNVQLAAQRAGLDLDTAVSWSELDIHRLVAHYLCIRFPICLALNKVDELEAPLSAVSASGDVVSVCQREAWERGEVAVPVSARAECWALQKLSRMQNGLHQKLPAVDSAQWNDEERRLEKCMSDFGSTGVLEAISEAVKLKPPVLCYPVGDVDSEVHVAWTPSMTQSEALRDCVQMKPGSTVEDLFEALKRGALPNATMHGEYVRAEGRALSRKTKKIQLRRDNVLSESNCVIKIMANRKAVWQSDIRENAPS